MNDLVDARLATMAAESGHREAVRMNANRLSYAQLQRGAANLADGFDRLDIGAGRCVGVFMPKSPMAVVALYGIMGAGAAYVPMDVSNPMARLRHMIGDCEMGTIVTIPDLLGRVEPLVAGMAPGMNIVLLAGDQPASPTHTGPPNVTRLDPFARGREAPRRPSAADAEPDRIAAVLYTSGSSGTPKGVMITHGAIDAFTRWSVTRFGLSATDRLASHAPLHFDLSLFDLFAAHRAGASTVLIPPGLAGSPKAITTLIGDQGITVWQSVPAILTMLAKYGGLPRQSPSPLRHVLFAGERMPVGTLKTLRDRFPQADFHNIYGATETNDTFIYSIPAAQQEIPDPLPIGMPLPDVAYRILDEAKTAVAPGDEGELYVRAATMMKGYRNRNDHGMVPIDDDSSGKRNYYRTRDVVRMLPDGMLHFCGRNDDIIKTGGHRVNLLEVERCLQACPRLQEVAVVALPDDELGHKIAAFVVPPDGATVTVIDLKLYCARTLAKYAIPHLFGIHRSPLPKTASGKIDKKRLKAQMFN